MPVANNPALFEFSCQQFAAAPAPAAGGSLFGGAGLGLGAAAPAPAPAAGGLFGQTPAAAPAGGLFGQAPAAAPAGGGLFGGTGAAPAFGAAPAAGGSLFGGGGGLGLGGAAGGATLSLCGGGAAGATTGGTAALGGAMAGGGAASGLPIRLNMTYEQLPQPTREWLGKLEHIISEWDWKSRQMPEAKAELSTCERLATSLERQADAASDSLRHDEGLLQTFKSQVEHNLADARAAEADFLRRHELQAYGRHGAIPSPYFAKRLHQMEGEVMDIKTAVRQLDGALEVHTHAASNLSPLTSHLSHLTSLLLTTLTTGRTQAAAHRRPAPRSTRAAQAAL